VRLADRKRVLGDEIHFEKREILFSELVKLVKIKKYENEDTDELLH
jgi:hypothetical protein